MQQVSYEGDLINCKRWSHTMDGCLTPLPPPAVCFLSLAVWLQGDFRHKSSFVIWGATGRRGASCWVRDVTCGTELHAVGPRSGHSSRSGEAQHHRNPTYSNLPKVTGFGGTTIVLQCRSVGVGDCFVEFHSSLASVLLWCCYFTVIAWIQASGRDCGTFLSPVSQSPHISTIDSFASDLLPFVWHFFSTVQICQSIFDGIYFKMPREKVYFFKYL